MTLSSLQTTLVSEQQNDTLTLNQNMASVTNITGFLGTLPNARVTLNNVLIEATPSTNPTSLAISGNVAESWTIPGVRNSQLSNVSLKITVTAPTTNTLQGTLQVNGNVTVGEHQLPMKGTLNDDNSITLQLDTDTTPTLSVHDISTFATNGRMHSFIPTAISWFDAITISALDLSFGFTPQSSTLISVSTDKTPQWDIVNGVVSLKEVGVTVNSAFQVTPDLVFDPSFSAYIHSLFHLGEDFNIRLGFTGRSLWELQFIPKDGNILPGLSALAGFIGGTSLQNTVQSGLNALNLGALSIDDVRIGIDMDKRTMSFINISTHILVAGVEVDTTIVLPEFTFVAFLSPSTPLHLKAIVEHYFGVADEFPEVNVSDFTLSATPSTGNYTVSVDIYDDWSFPVGSSSLAFKEFAFNINKTSEGFSGFIEATIDLFGVTFTLSATEPSAGGGWLFLGITQPEDAINLTHFLDAMLRELNLPELPANIPELTIKNLELDYDTQAQSFTFRGETDVDIPGVVQLGNQQHTVQTQVEIISTINPTTGSRTFQGFLRGEINFGTATFQIEYDFQDESIIRGVWDTSQGGTLGFNDLTGGHNIDHSLAPPDGMDLALSEAVFEYNITQGKFFLSAKSTRYGEAFFITSNANNRWDFVFGVVVELSNIPGFPDVGELEIKEVSLLLSTVNDTNFKVPPLPSFPTTPGKPATVPATRRVHPAIGTSPIKLKAGVSIAAVLDLETSGQNSVLASNLQKTMNAPELIIQAVIADPINQSAVYAALMGGLTIMGDGNTRITLSNVMIQFGLTPLSILIAGSVFVPIDQITLEATGAAAISTEALEAIFDVKAEEEGRPAELPFPFGMMGVRLSELGVAIGAVFTPPGVELGLEGMFNVVGQPAGVNQFTLILELEEEIPNPLLLSTYIETLSLETLFTAETGLPTDDMPIDIPPILKEIQASSLSIYWSETPGLFLPDGTISKAGFGFNGFISIGGFTAHAGLDVSSISGISGNAELPPINFKDVVSVTGDGKGISIKQEKIDGQWVTARSRPFSDSEKTAPVETRTYQIVSPGGATVEINSKHSPYIDISLKVNLFDLVHEDLEVEVTSSSFKFILITTIGSAAKVDIEVTLTKDNFTGHAEFDLNIAGAIGPITILGVNVGTIDLDVSLAAVLDIHVDKDGFSVRVNGDFQFDDYHLTLPELNIKEKFSSLAELPAKILKHIADNAEDIFKDVFNEAKQLLQDAEAEAQRIAAAVDQEVQQIAQDAEQEAQRIAEDAERVYNSMVSGLADIEGEAKKLEQEAQQLLSDAQAEVSAITTAVDKEVKALEDQANQLLQDATQEATKILQAADAELDKLNKQAQQILGDAASEVKSIADTATRDVTAIANEATRQAKALLDEAEQLAGEMEAEANKILDDIEEAAKKAETWVEDTADDAWDTVKKY